MERLQSTRAARRRHSTKIINEVGDLLASNEFDLAGLRSILQRLEKSTDELVKANEALHAEMTDDEVLADFDSVLEYEDRAAGCVGLLRHHIQELTIRSSVPSRPNGELPTDSSLSSQASPRETSVDTGALSSQPAPREPSVVIGARLPKLDLTRFDGSPTKWLPFWDLFRHSVHENPRLNNVDRFHYLRSLLDGPAAKAIAGILTTDNSYEDAISTLKERFGDVRVIEQRHIENLRTLRPVTMSANASALRSLYDFVQVNIRGLKGLGVSESNYAAMLCEVLMKSIPQDIMVE